MSKVITIKLGVEVDFNDDTAILTKYGVTDIRPDLPDVAIEGIIDPAKFEQCKAELMRNGYEVVE